MLLQFDNTSQSTSQYQLLSSNNKLELSNLRKITRRLSVKDSILPKSSPQAFQSRAIEPTVVLRSAFQIYRFFAVVFLEMVSWNKMHHVKRGKDIYFFFYFLNNTFFAVYN